MSHDLRCLHYPFARQSRSRKLRRQLLVTKEKRWRFMRLDPIIPKTLQVAVLPGTGVVPRGRRPENRLGYVRANGEEHG